MEFKHIFKAHKSLIRNIQIKDHFEDDRDNNYDQTKFTSPSTWTPKLSRASTETKKTINDIVQSTSKPVGTNFIRTGDRQNLTNEQSRSLRLLTAREDIIIRTIRPADKGSSVCIMDPDHYHNEIMRQLNDNTYYHTIDGTLRHNNVTNINAIVDTLLIDGFITERQYDYLKLLAWTEIDRSISCPRSTSPRWNGHIHGCLQADLLWPTWEQSPVVSVSILTHGYNHWRTNIHHILRTLMTS